MAMTAHGQSRQATEQQQRVSKVTGLQGGSGGSGGAAEEAHEGTYPMTQGTQHNSATTMLKQAVDF